MVIQFGKSIFQMNITYTNKTQTHTQTNIQTRSLQTLIFIYVYTLNALNDRSYFLLALVFKSYNCKQIKLKTVIELLYLGRTKKLNYYTRIMFHIKNCFSF